MKNRTFLLLGFSFLIAVMVIVSGQERPSLKRNDYPNSRIDTFDVVHYTINLTEIDFVHKSIKGFTDLQIVLKRDNVDTILLDLVELTVDSVWVDEIGIESFRYDKRWLKVPLPFRYDRGTSVQVSVFYHGKPATDPAWGGFYFSDRTAYNMGVAMKFFPHNFGRAWYPCVDNFIDKATYDYFITVDTNLTAVCSGILEETFPNDNGTNTFFWSLKQEIPTYLSSVAISDYIAIHDTIEGLLGPIPSSVYVSPQEQLNGIKSFANLPRYAAHFETLFGPYRWDRIGFVTVPSRGGAMEHATNIAVSERSVDGTLGSEILFVHELAHSWFGNLVTCQRDEDMWLNEGLASYAEALFIEQEYGTKRFKEYVRRNHEKVLRMVHIRDEGYYPVAGIPHELTYSSTVYNKGADVAHTLRGYLGDELFFTGLKEYFDQYRYRDISSAGFRDFFSRITETDLTDFFNSWVFSPGFPHFSVDSFRLKQGAAGYDVRLFLRQKLKGTDAFFFSNRVEVTFMDKNWNSCTETIDFSGERSERSLFIPFAPSLVMVDPEEKVADATTGHLFVIDSVGHYAFYAAYCVVQVEKVTDSTLLRVVHNWVAPDDFRDKRANQVISTSRYWKIEGLFPGSFVARGSFTYNTNKSGRSGWLDPDLQLRSENDLILYYRESAAEDWVICDYSIVGDRISGKIVVDKLLPGEYAIGQYLK